MAEKMNGSTVDGNNCTDKEEMLQDALHRLVSSIIYPEASASGSAPLLHRIKTSVSENVPRLGEASRNTSRSVLQWTRSGSPLRAILVISVGTVTCLTLTGLLVFMLFFLAATVNAIIISFLIALAAAGGFLAIFFACVTVIYIGALSVAAFVISTATISAIIAAVVATGWVGFFWALWLGTKKSMDLAKHSFSMTGSALSVYSSARHAHHHQGLNKVSD
ncbi:LDAP Interacting Protein [Hibiscus trionum]|uniref:LDAP Interacting Protein n=2 Tax=Hibiscus trionum TaxID=183268 RepID=A0A9W7HY65_HIBTR|nr:LDAP Interacting Protein [Hibiscus trionum]